MSYVYLITKNLVPVYVGKGKNNRIYQHRKRFGQDGLTETFLVENISEKDALKYEEIYIALFGVQNLHNKKTKGCRSGATASEFLGLRLYVVDGAKPRRKGTAGEKMRSLVLNKPGITWEEIAAIATWNWPRDIFRDVTIGAMRFEPENEELKQMMIENIIKNNGYDPRITDKNRGSQYKNKGFYYTVAKEAFILPGHPGPKLRQEKYPNLFTKRELRGMGIYV